MPALGLELFVGADLNETSAVQHDDEVRHAHRRESMRHQDRNVAVAVALRRGGVALEQRMFSFGVQRRRRFVEHEQERGVAHETAREREFLPLTERHLHTPGPGRTQLRVEARHQP